MADEAKKSRGYGHPPIESRFKPGESGNPRGRPKRTLSVRAALEKILSEPFGEGTKLDGVIRDVVDDALAGNAHSRRDVFELCAKYLRDEDQKKVATPTATADDQTLLKDFAERENQKTTNVQIDLGTNAETDNGDKDDA